MKALKIPSPTKRTFVPSCSQTCRRRPLHPPLPLQSANSPYHFCDRAYSIFPVSTILFPDTLFRSSHTSPPLVRSRYTPANERKRFTPSPFSTSKGVSPPPLHPSSGSKPLSPLCFFSSMQHHPNDFSLSPPWLPKDEYYLPYPHRRNS